MKKVITAGTLVVFVLAGCAGIGAPGQEVSGSWGQSLKFYHDTDHKVGCWFIVGTNGGGGSITCLPDNQYTLKPGE